MINGDENFEKKKEFFNLFKNCKKKQILKKIFQKAQILNNERAFLRGFSLRIFQKSQRFTSSIAK